MASLSRLLIWLFVTAAGYQISPQVSFYPRTTTTNDNILLSCVTNLTSYNDGTVIRELSLYNAVTPTNISSWSYYSAIIRVNDTNGTIDLDNCHIIQSRNNTLIAAFRFHTQCSSSVNNNIKSKNSNENININIDIHDDKLSENCLTYRLMSSNSYDYGVTWTQPSLIASLEYNTSQTQPGLWEPFLFVSNDSNSLMVFYSKELWRDSKLQQNIVMQYSFNNGINWDMNDYIVCNKSNSRNGMPSVARLNDASLMVTMEGFWSSASSCGYGSFTVAYVRSYDNGKTWTDGGIIYAPCEIENGYNAGAPWVVAENNSGEIFVSFMCNYNVNDKSHSNSETWPGGAWIQVLQTRIGNNGDLVFNESNIHVMSGIDSYWAAMFILQKVGSKNNQVFVEYQSNASTFINHTPM